MEIRQTTNLDLDTILSIYAIARQYMRNSGNKNQWINNYPSDEVLLNDISNQNSYVILNENKIVGVFTFILGEDPTYSYIENGKWLNDKPYGTIHRIASSMECSGIFKETLEFALSKVANVRIDTHRDNKTMQHLVIKNGFTRCGVIYLTNGDPRDAFQIERKKSY